MENGMIVKFGAASLAIGNAGVTVTFTTAFPTERSILIAQTHLTDATQSDDDVDATFWTRDAAGLTALQGFEARGWSMDLASTVYWLAIGY
jgi:hypothetical protein